MTTEADEDRREARDRTRAVHSILERCTQELSLLEAVPHLSVEEVNGLSAAKGFCERARSALERGFGPHEGRRQYAPPEIVRLSPDDPRVQSALRDLVTK
jgi:hypothetical protein